jgi:hypothetical protein
MGHFRENASLYVHTIPAAGRDCVSKYVTNFIVQLLGEEFFFLFNHTNNKYDYPAYAGFA